jgi:UDP-galactopyranose mutase
MPLNGYTKMFYKILSNKNIEVVLDTDYKSILNDIKFDKMIYTGPIDYFFDYKFGKLPYRSIKFEMRNFEKAKYQDTAVINYVECEPEQTRVTEYKYLTGQQNKSTTISKEFPQKNGEPYYPIPTIENQKLYKKYNAETAKIKNVKFCGRLAEFRYYDMDQVVAECLNIFKKDFLV